MRKLTILVGLGAFPVTIMGHPEIGDEARFRRTSAPQPRLGGDDRPVWKPRSCVWAVMYGIERGFCLLKGIAEGTYNSKHAEAAKLYYTTI